MPLPILAPTSDAALAVERDWLAHLARHATSAAPPPGRAIGEAGALAAERSLLGRRRARVW